MLTEMLVYRFELDIRDLERLRLSDDCTDNLRQVFLLRGEYV